MKKCLFILFYFILLFNTNVYGQTFFKGYDYSGVHSFDEKEVHVNNGAIVSTSESTILIDYPKISLYNKGTINGAIDLNDNNLFLYNAGTISGTINIGTGLLRQIITPEYNNTNVSVNGNNFQVSIENYDNLKFDDIKNINATSFEITESNMVISNFTDWQNWDKTVIKSSNVKLIIENIGDIGDDGVLIKNTKDISELNIETPNLDELHKTYKKRTNEGFVLYIVRETNYEKIDPTETGKEESISVLEEIKNIDPEDKLIAAIDKAKSAEEINYLKSQSARFNYSFFLQPIKIINNFAILNQMGNKDDSGVGADVSYITSGKVKAFGGRMYVGYNYDNLYFNMGLKLNKFSYENSLNEFSGLLYGMDINAKQKFSNLWFRENMGANLIKFDANYVSHDNEIKNEPNAFTWYGNINFGYDFNFTENVIFSPFVGTTYQKYKVIDVVESDLDYHAGFDVQYNIIVDGIKYEYDILGGIKNDNNWFSTIKMGILSVGDAFGVFVDASVMTEEQEYNYMLSLKAKLMF